MGHQHRETYHLDREAAEAAQKVTGTPGYSEVYARGVFPCKLKKPFSKELVDGWVSKTETYYG
jgi:DNA-directed RNA polymerase subunit E'/Rpb7